MNFCCYSAFNALSSFLLLLDVIIVHLKALLGNGFEILADGFLELLVGVLVSEMRVHTGPEKYPARRKAHRGMQEENMPCS